MKDRSDHPSHHERTGHSYEICRFQTTDQPATDPGRTACTPLYPPVQPPLYSHTLFFLSRTEEPAKVGTCARDRRELQQPSLNVHVKQ